MALSLLSFSVCLGSLTLCLLVFLQERPRSLMNASYFISAIAGAAWAFGYTVIYQTEDPATAVLFYRISSVGWTVGIAYAFLFTYYLYSTVVGQKPSTVIVLLTNLSAGVFWLAAWKGLVFASRFERVAVGWLERTSYTSPWVVAFSIWMVFINAMMILFTILAGRKAILNRYRRMVRMILFPSALFGPVAIFTSLALPLAGVGWIPPLVHILFGVLTIFIGLALLRFRMLSIEPAFVIERLFFDITDMVVLTDMGGVIRKSNQTLSNQANLFPESLAGKPLRVILPEVELRGQVIYRAPQKVVFETNLRLPTGETIPVRGALSVVADIHDDPVGYYFLLHDLRDMRRIAQYAADLEETNQKLELFSKTDILTGIWNRAKFNEMLQIEFERFKRYGEPFSVILFDIDKFKIINDTCGHLGGDVVLKQVVDNVKQAIRGTDIFARWGGDEFAVLSPHLDTGGIALVAERIRRAVASISVDEMGVTASIGMTIVTRNDTVTVLFERADAAVYSAKEQGGNCFVLG